MGRLDIRFDKKNLGADLKLGIVADVLQVADSHGSFPELPFEQEVVIPAGASLSRQVDVPPGTYRIEARLPSGEMMSEVRKVPEGEAEVSVIFQPANSPHEWLSWQRLAGNVPSEKEYEQFLQGLAAKVATAAEAKKVKIEFSPTAIGWAAGHLRRLHVHVKSMLDRAPGAGGAASMEADAAEAPGLPDFELVQADPRDGAESWDTLSSYTAWSEWRKTASAYPADPPEPTNDRGLSLWQITPQYYETKMVETPHGKMPLRCLGVLRRGAGVEVILLPMAWKYDLHDKPVTIEVLREAGAADAGRTTVVVKDPDLGGLLMYLGNKKIGKAATVLAEARQTGLIDALLEKQANPLAACAAAYVAIAGMTTRDREESHDRFKRLSEVAWLPDGSVIDAAYLLKTARSKSERQDALVGLKEAYRKGIPYFIAGVEHLQQGLYSFSEKDDEAREMYGKVTNVAMQVDANQVFTLVRLPPEQT